MERVCAALLYRGIIKYLKSPRRYRALHVFAVEKAVNIVRFMLLLISVELSFLHSLYVLLQRVSRHYTIKYRIRY